MNYDESKGTLANIQSIQRLDDQPDTKTEGQAIAEAQSAEEVGQPNQEVNH